MKQKITFNNKAIYSLIALGILILFVSADFCSATTQFRSVASGESSRPRTLTSSQVSNERSVASGESSRPRTLTSSAQVSDKRRSIADYQRPTGSGLQPAQTEADADAWGVVDNAFYSGYVEESVTYSLVILEEDMAEYFATYPTTQGTGGIADYQRPTGSGLQPAQTEADADAWDVVNNALEYGESFEEVATYWDLISYPATTQETGSIADYQHSEDKSEFFVNKKSKPSAFRIL